MRIGIVDGRDFRENDTKPGVAIVNETFAKQYFNGRIPWTVVRDEASVWAERALRDCGAGTGCDVSRPSRAILPQAYLPIINCGYATSIATKTPQWQQMRCSR